MEIGTFENINRKKWNEVLEKAKNATVFHTLEWLEIQKKIFGMEEMLLFSKDCIFPIFIKRKGPFTIYGSPVPETGSLYGGPLCCSVEGYLKTLNFFKRLGLFSSLFIKTPNNFDISIFEKECIVEPVGNYILDLKKSEEELWRNLNKKTRNAIRKAKKSGIKVEFCDSSYLDEYYEMVKEVSQRGSIVPLPKEFMKEVLDSQIGKLLLAFYKDKPVAGGIFLTFKNTVTYWDGASYSKYRSYQPSNLLQWELIIWAKENYSYYDLGGAGIPRITRFKKGWGGKYVEYYRVYKEGIIAKFARMIYQKLRVYPAISKFFRS
ncbi:MAG: hypothetical protein DRI61_16480 [Chloroflexi bacterium]|nr:MAG: hypothetical protein DRI61_16480 [Chloroflexota bacterium]